MTFPFRGFSLVEMQRDLVAVGAAMRSWTGGHDEHEIEAIDEAANVLEAMINRGLR